ncbi:retrovirus-related pol polyprotein from transposon TNT 1-94 [Tanacetum coccineum]
MDEKRVSSNNNEMVEVKVLMALAEENDAISKEAELQRNIIDPLVTVTDFSTTDYDSTHESSVCSTPLPPLKRLDGVEPVSGPKTIKSILRSKSTFKVETLKDVIINKPSLAPAKGNNSSSASKVNSALADCSLVSGLRMLKTYDREPLSAHELRQQISRHCLIRKRPNCKDNGNLEGVDLLSRSKDTNLYTISLDDMLKTSPICLLSKASKTKSWLWHHRLSYLNFGTLNKLAKDGLARGLLKLKFKKDHLCSACALGKSKKSSHQPNAEYTNQEKLYLLHMDLCGPMRVETINGKKYILVIVDDYS